MTRVLIDTNVVLDVLLGRQAHVRDSAAVWGASDDGLFDGCIASFSIPTIYYVCRKHQDEAAALAAVDLCVESFEIAPLYRECVLAARRMGMSDFEDGLQVATAITDFSQGIVTRNVTDFATSPLRVYTPRQFLATLG